MLLAAYTTENQNQVSDRVRSVTGVIPSHITVTGWMSLLINEGAKPYQRAISGKPFFITGMNFDGEPRRGINKTNPRYFLDSKGRLYRRNLSDFVVQLNKATDGAVIRRIERLYSHILIDEAQDLSGWDLDLLDLLLQADVDVTLVADPRQHIYATNQNPKNKGKGGANLLEWVEERSSICAIEKRVENYRSNQPICDFADSLYPDLPKSKSVAKKHNGHSGIHMLKASDVETYWHNHQPQVLRNNLKSSTMELEAINFGISKGSDFDHVLIFPTQPIRKFLADGDPSTLKPVTRAKLYVAVTRARHSVAFVAE